MKSVYMALLNEHCVYAQAILSKFDVDTRRGFLPSQDPLQRLPYARYSVFGLI